MDHNIGKTYPLVRVLILLVLVLVVIACGQGSAANEYGITSALCSDNEGPNCNKLRLGDDYLTTASPARGYLYSCTGKNPNAPGSIESRITWIDFSTHTWNFLEKLWLPKGTFDPGKGTYSETVSGDIRKITTNSIPMDGMIGDWPMTSYTVLSAIDPNPGLPRAIKYSADLPLQGTEAKAPGCVSPGAIGVTKNGVTIYNAADGRGEDAVAREIVDVFGGHPARGDYHYHFIPERLDNNFLIDGHSGIVGYINDGFPIYGYRGVGSVEMSNKDLDLCHGHEHGELNYHYHATLEYPYTVGCYKGEVSQRLAVNDALKPITRPDHGPLDMSGAAHMLGIPEADLMQALGPPPPDLGLTSEILGISETDLRNVLGLPR